MQEFEEVMGRNAYEQANNHFDLLTPQQAIDKVRLLVQTGGNEAINNDPKSLQLIKSMARITDEDVTVWVRKFLVDNNDGEKFEAYEKEVKMYRFLCRQALGLEQNKPTVN